MALHLSRSKHRSLRNPSLLHLFSTSSNDPNNQNDDNNNPPSISSYFTNPKPQNQTPTSKTIPITASLQEIRKNLSEYRRRAAVPPPNQSQSQSQPNTTSFQEIYRRNMLAKQGDPNNNNETPTDGGFGSGPGGKFKLDAIRNSLRQMRQDHGGDNLDRKQGSYIPLSEYKNTLKMKPLGQNMASSVIGGSSSELPSSVFGREMRDTGKRGDGSAMKMEFVRSYGYEDLGKKLKDLQPEVKKEGWFSLNELKERLTKLRESEEKEIESRKSGYSYADLRESLHFIKTSTEENQKKAQKIEILDVLGRTPEFMIHPPKEHLVEKYFHPDNMSSAEKLKTELAKVRDEFKMSESDCGSARVQVAQLTTKIKHLSPILHKKDKHSRKGLIAMVQKRKKLLKYLRRTDWDSYCFVLSKLGLRDTADSKN